jgi:hypothetical protein
MPGFNTLPAVGGGGGQANMTFVASIHMNTYNRRWTQGGTAGHYAMYSTNQENGYAYFVGSGTTTGVALNRLANITHSFTRIDVIAPQNDMLSLYKAKVKSTTEFPDAFAAFSSFPSVINTSGNFVLPNNALPLVNVLVCGAGGSGGQGHTSHGGSGGGAGGGVVKLTAYQAVGTTGVVIGAGGSSGPGHNGGRTFFGNVYALGGGYASTNHDGAAASYYRGADVANYGGNSSYYGNITMISPVAQTATTGLGVSGSPAFHGGFTGGTGTGGSDGHNRGGGGGGAGGNGVAGGNQTGGNGGLGHISDISGTNLSYGPGGQGHGAHGGGGPSGWDRRGLSPIGHGAHGGSGTNNNGSGTGNGNVTVRYYIP